MKKKQTKELLLSPLGKGVLARLKAVDFEELSRYYSEITSDEKERRIKVRGFLMLHEALQLLEGAKNNIP
jgi:hypothetical protein